MASHDIDALMRRILDAEARMFDAEATILEELAKAMPRHVDDPKWLKAAAKECCIAELIHALAEKEREGKADLAINTYDTDCGIAGWVFKRQDGQNFELPHIGFRLSSGVLIWINQKHDAQCNALEEHFSIMFEWVNEDGVYGILGKRFKLTGSGPRELTRAEGAYRGEQHGGVYRHP